MVSDLDSNWHDVIYYSKNLDNTSKYNSLASSQAKSSWQQRRANKIDLDRVLMAETNSYSAKISLLESRYDLLLAKYKLYFNMGKIAEVI